MSISKRGQVWVTDFILSLLIIVVALAIFGRAILNITSANQDVRPLIMEGRSFSDSLISEGYPVDWNSSSVSRIGLTADKRINDTKISAFYAMDYDDVKERFNSRYDFYVFMVGYDNKLINVSGKYGLGHGLVNATQDSVVLSGLDFDRLVKIERLTIYDSKIVRLVIYIWK